MPGLSDAVSGLLTTLETYDSPLDMSHLSQAFGVRPSTLAIFVRDFVASVPREPRLAQT